MEPRSDIKKNWMDDRWWRHRYEIL